MKDGKIRFNSPLVISQKPDCVESVIHDKHLVPAIDLTAYSIEKRTFDKVLIVDQ